MWASAGLTTHLAAAREAYSAASRALLTGASRAPALAALTIASMEGAVAIARSEGDLTHFDLTAMELLEAAPDTTAT